MPAPRTRPNQTALKLGLLILATGAVSAEILASRAQRLRAAHSATAALEEARALERALDQSRLDIAALSAPDRVRALIENDHLQMAPLFASPEPTDQ